MALLDLLRWAAPGVVAMLAATDYRRGYPARARLQALVALALGASAWSRVNPSRALDIVSWILAGIVLIVTWRYLNARVRGTAA